MNILTSLISENILQQLNAKKETYWQEWTIRRLLKKGSQTDFGKFYDFSSMRQNREYTIENYRNTVPIQTYKSLRKWWENALDGKSDITWPGEIPFWATSSGTSDGRQKHIPVTHELMKSIYRGGFMQFLAVRHADLPPKHFTKKILCISGSSKLNSIGTAEAGYISGITAQKMPKWFEFYHKPGRQINTLDWEEKVEKIVENAPKWDVGSLVGLPNWSQIVLERIIETYNLNDIHEIWPNFNVFQHSGMSFDPYRANFDRITGRSLYLFETYFASEGIFALSKRPTENGKNKMQLLTGNGIFFEFIPFDSAHFDDFGELKKSHKTLLINELEEKTMYAIVISTNAGLWRYLLGDVVQFTNLAHLELEIVGRTSTFLNTCGEHLTEANLNEAVGWLNSNFNCDIRAFSIAPEMLGNQFSHHWYLSTTGAFSANFLCQNLDARLRKMNEYYDFERSVSLKSIQLTVVPEHFFKKWLEQKASSQPQQKFPRVLNGQNLMLWKSMLESENKHNTLDLLRHNSTT
jgi:GH3 auxin-responsive promoter